MTINMLYRRRGRDYNVYPDDFYHKQNYACPLSYQAAMGRCLVLLWQLTQNDKYLAMGSDIAIAIKSTLKDNGGYAWGIFIGEEPEDEAVADVSHSTVTIHFAVLAYEAGVVVNPIDMERFATTVRNLWQDGRVTRYIDGSGDYAYKIAAGQYSFLAQFDPQIWNLCYDLLFRLNRVDITASYFQEDWWGTVMLGIARLAHFVPTNNY